MSSQQRLIFFRALRGNLLVYFFDALLFTAGFLIAIGFNLFASYQWALVLYPGLLITKSIVGEIINERVSTGLHLGTVYPRLGGNTRVFLDILRDGTLATALIGLAVSLFTWIFGLVFWKFNLFDLVELSIALLSTLGLSILILPLTEKLVFEAFNRGIDLEQFVHPSAFALSGFITTGIYLGVLSTLYIYGVEGTYAAASIAVLFVVVVLLDIITRVRKAVFRRFVSSFLPVLALSSVAAGVAGSVYGEISSLAQQLPEVFTVYPALIFVGANLSLVIGTTATTRLALGLLKPNLRSVSHHCGQILAGWFDSMLIFTVLSGVALAVNGGYRLDAIFAFITVLLLSNIIAVTFIVILAFSFAVLAFRRGFDLESFVIPAEEVLSVLIMTIALLVALLVIHYV